jgi:hypothetical protein
VLPGHSSWADCTARARRPSIRPPSHPKRRKAGVPLRLLGLALVLGAACLVSGGGAGRRRRVRRKERAIAMARCGGSSNGLWEEAVFNAGCWWGPGSLEGASPRAVFGCEQQDCLQFLSQFATVDLIKYDGFTFLSTLASVCDNAVWRHWGLLLLILLCALFCNELNNSGRSGISLPLSESSLLFLLPLSCRRPPFLTLLTHISMR